MQLPNKEKIEELLKDIPEAWNEKDQQEAFEQLKNLYEHWYRIEIK